MRMRYKDLAVPKDAEPHRQKQKSIKQHILMAEKAIGHALPPKAQVHHLDGNGTNNEPANLVICENAAYHRLLHVRQRILARGFDPDSAKAFCGHCSRPIASGKPGMCGPCNREYQRERYRAIGFGTLPQKYLADDEMW